MNAPFQEVLCPACGGGNTPGFVYCQWCGHKRSEPYRVPTKQVEKQSAGMPCLGTTLLLLGVIGIIGSLGITIADLSGANVFQAQPIILFGIMLTIGSFLLFMLPGILLLRRRG